MYWKNEKAKRVQTEANVLQYYKDSERLAVSLPSWTDDKGQLKFGKTVTINIEALLESDSLVMIDAKAIFQDIANKLADRIELVAN